MTLRVAIADRVAREIAAGRQSPRQPSSDAHGIVAPWRRRRCRHPCDQHHVAAVRRRSGIRERTVVRPSSAAPISRRKCRSQERTACRSPQPCRLPIATPCAASTNIRSPCTIFIPCGRHRAASLALAVFIDQAPHRLRHCSRHAAARDQCEDARLGRVFGSKSPSASHASSPIRNDASKPNPRLAFSLDTAPSSSAIL